MKLQMRFNKRNSQEEIENSFNPINLDYIFQEDDPLSPWIEEREDPLLDGQNSEWLPRMDSEDEETEAEDESNSNEGDNHSGDGGLSPPSNNSGGDRGATESDHNMDEQDPYQEIPYPIRGQNIVIDMSSFQDRDLGDSRTGGSQSMRGGRQQTDALEDSYSSNFSQSFNDFGISESSQSSQGHNSYPPYYQQPPISYDPYLTSQAPPYYQPSINYQQPYFPHHQQTENTSGGFFDYVFGQGSRQGDDGSENRGYDPPRHSTMW